MVSSLSKGDELERRGGVRVYNAEESVVFRKTHESFGGLSNMAGGYHICINGNIIPSSEALYQACRYAYHPDVQKEIISQRSPMTAKMISRKYTKSTRVDWDEHRLKIMQWCIRAKLMCNYLRFSNLLLATGNKSIVEESTRDLFWAAIRRSDGLLEGCNVLGRLLMELRCHVRLFGDNFPRHLPPLRIANFALLGSEIGAVDLYPQGVGSQNYLE